MMRRVMNRARRLVGACMRAHSLWQRYSEDAFQLANILDAAPSLLGRPQQHPERVSIERAQRVCNWYVPPFENAFYGGIMTILRFADFLRTEHGMRQQFLVCGRADRDAIAASIAAAFPSLGRERVMLLDTSEAIAAIPAADYSFATLWTTAYVLLQVPNAGLKFYFIQDFEPLFYPAGSTFSQAEHTYRFGFHSICNTIGVKEAVEAVSGQQATHFVPRVDSKVFYHRDDRSRPRDRKRLFYYARPGHPRNAFELGASALLRLKYRMGDKVEIVTAGDSASGTAKVLDGIVSKRGLLPYEATGDLYRSCHVGLAFMLTKHPSYIPLELMACGALVVSNINHANRWLMRDRENCLLAPPTATAIAETLESALEHWHEFSTLRRSALRDVEGSTWEAEFARVLLFMESFHSPSGTAAGEARDG